MAFTSLKRIIVSISEAQGYWGIGCLHVFGKMGVTAAGFSRKRLRSLMNIIAVDHRPNVNTAAARSDLSPDLHMSAMRVIGQGASFRMADHPPRTDRRYTEKSPNG